jgi:predicted transcriptional regulator
MIYHYNNFKEKTMGKGRPEKYNRITSQQKYMLRRLIIKEKMSVKQVILAFI